MLKGPPPLADTPFEMTTIRATCPTCGEVEMGATAVLLTVESGGAEGCYSFVCPVCEDTVEKRADRKVVMLLLSAGVEVQEVAQLSLPQETPAQTAAGAAPQAAPVRPSASRVPDGPPLTTDDLIDFHFLLQRDDWDGLLFASGE
jgi:hypothetical protein